MAFTSYKLNRKHAKGDIEMKAALMLDDSMSKKTYRRLNAIDKETLIILTDKIIFNNLKEKKPDYSFIYVDIFSEKFSFNALELTEKFAKEINNQSKDFYLKNYNLFDMTINSFYGNFIKMVTNLVLSLREIIDAYNITDLILYEGSPKVQFSGVTLSEGERSFRFIYKRSWYLNYFVYNAFSEEIVIRWKSKTPYLYLSILNHIKPDIILLGKLALLLKRKIMFNKNTEYKNKSGKDYSISNKPLIVIPVRNPIQVVPLVSIYNEILNNNKEKPIYLTLENYSNNKLQSLLQDKALEFFDLYSLLTFKKIIDYYFRVKQYSRSKTTKKKYVIDIERNNIKVKLEPLIRELTIYWFDVVLYEDLLKNFEEKVNGKTSIKNIINNETHGHYAAFEGEWAKQKGITSIGIQHVAIPDTIKPRISWVDNMFMMSKEIFEKLSILKQDERFSYVGPIAYDLYFNTSNFRLSDTITIFTQPDDYKCEYVQIIKDVIHIIERNDLRYKVIVKLHPREKDIKTFVNLKNLYKDIEILTNQIDSLDLIKASRFVISIFSGTLMQSIIIGTPGISINYANKYEINMDFINDEITKKVYSKNELEYIMLNEDKFIAEYLKNRSKYLSDNLEGYSGNASKEVYSFINN